MATVRKTPGTGKSRATRSAIKTAATPAKGRQKPAKQPAGVKAMVALANVLTAPPAPRNGGRTRKANPAKPEASGEAVEFKGRLADATKAIHVLNPDLRPRSGRALKAHTHAALTVLGLIDSKRPGVPKSSLLSIIGPVAVSHHVEKGNFEVNDGGRLRLTSAGYNEFSSRVKSPGFDVGLATSYQELFLDGKHGALAKSTEIYAVGIHL